MTTTTLTLTRPDDWHLHVRDGAAMHAVVPHTAAQFARAIIMPNLKPPVTTTEQALAYKARILAAVPAGVPFEPLMTLYLTDNLAARGNRPRQGRWHGGLQALPGRCHHQQRPWRDRSAQATPCWKPCSARACCCSCTAKSPAATSTCSTARPPSSTSN